MGLIWLQQVSKDKPRFFSKLTKGEKKIARAFVDRFDEETNTIYQFQGCFYHGCLKCYSASIYNEVLSVQFGKLNHRTCVRSDHLHNLGYNVVEQRECEFINENNLSREKIKEQKKSDFFHVYPLEPRAALFGGRTSPAVLQKHCEKDEKIFYNDFTSLYPYVQKTFDYPLGHPDIYIGEECSDYVKSVFGLIKCKVLPPKGLLFPILPSQINVKLFTLCKTCAKIGCSKCCHDEEGRCLQETWTSVELKKALEFGYIINEIYDYKKKGKIFQDYVNAFLKIKQESSGFPANCFDENGHIKEFVVDEYINAYLDNEGISMDWEKII